LGGITVGLAVPIEHRLGRGFQFLRALRELGARAAPMFRSVAWQLHPINREHLAPDQPLAVAHREHGRKHLRDVVAERADEMGDGGEVRRRHTA